MWRVNLLYCVKSKQNSVFNTAHCVSILVQALLGTGLCRWADSPLYLPRGDLTHFVESVAALVAFGATCRPNDFSLTCLCVRRGVQEAVCVRVLMRETENVSVCVFVCLCGAHAPAADLTVHGRTNAAVRARACGPSRPFRVWVWVWVCAARTLNATGQSRVTLSLR